jgi:hypothetical protein
MPCTVRKHCLTILHCFETEFAPALGRKLVSDRAHFHSELRSERRTSLNKELAQPAKMRAARCTTRCAARC